MKKLLLPGIAALVLTACSGQQAKLQGLCTGMLEGDLKAQQELASSATNVADFCECYAGKASATGKEALATHTAIWSALSDIQQAGGTNSIEEAAETLEDQIRARSVEHPFTEDQFESVGQFLSDIDDGFKRTGACPST